jgi:hypothetical protein
MVPCTKFVESVDNFVHTLTKLSILSGQYEYCSRRLFTYTVYHALQVWTILSTLSGQYEYCSRRLFTLLLTCTVHIYCLPCSSSVDNFVHTLFKLSTLFCEEFTVHIKYCLRISQKVWTKLSTLCSNCPHFYQKEFTVHVKHCLRI